MSTTLPEPEIPCGDLGVDELVLGSTTFPCVEDPSIPTILAVGDDEADGNSKEGDDEGDGFERDDDEDGLIPWTEVEQPVADFDENDFDDDFDDDFEVDIEEEEFDDKEGELDLGESGD